MSNQIYCLSVRQPWAWLIVNGYKTVENRTWHTSFRGRFLVHAAKTMTRSEWYRAACFVRKFDPLLVVKMPNPEMFGSGLSGGMLGGAGLGGIVGEATLHDCVSSYDSPWFEGPYGFALKNAQALPFVLVRGRLGFFTYECTHNQMVKNSDPAYVWKCALCGYVYGKLAATDAGTLRRERRDQPKGE